MSEQSKIEWTDHTWSPWFGCTKVSDGCDHCYAATDNERWKRNGTGGWGPGAPRVMSKGWDMPRSWERRAAKTGIREKVFPSLCDPFDKEAPPFGREELFTLISDTPHLDWLLLTKRPQLAAVAMSDSDCARHNVWLGTSVESPRVTNRIDILRRIPAVIRFLSIEPLLEDVGTLDLTGIHWVIVGGESGHGARPCNIEWIRSIVAQCKAADVPVFVKQLGTRCVTFGWVGDYPEDWPSGSRLHVGETMESPRWAQLSHKGGKWEEWPADLRIREFPKAEVIR